MSMTEAQMNEIMSRLTKEERAELIEHYRGTENQTEENQIKNEKNVLLAKIKSNTLNDEDKYKILTTYPILVISLFTHIWTNIGNKPINKVTRFEIDGKSYFNMDLDKTMNVLFNTYRERCTVNNISAVKRLNKREIHDHISQHIDQINSEKMMELYESLKYDGHSTMDEALEKYMKVIEMIRDKSSMNKLHAIQLMHTVARIKKKMYLDDIEEDDTGKNPITLYLYGPQNYGKTLLMKSLFSKFNNEFIVCSNGTSEFNDNRQKKGILSSLVYFIEEMGTLNHLALDNLKSWNTSNKDSYRRMYSNEVDEIAIRTTFIGASNKPIDQTINDSTGMRRFWQIDYTKKINSKEVKQLKSEGFFDELFSCLDEESFDEFYEDFIPQIEKVQRSYLNSKDIFTIFKEDCGIELKDANDFEYAVPSTYMYFAMLKFSYDNGYIDALKDIGIFIPSEDLNTVIKEYEEGDKKATALVRKNTQTFSNNSRNVMKPYGQGLSQYGRVSKYLITCNDELEKILQSMEGYMKIKKEGDEKLLGKKH